MGMFIFMSNAPEWATVGNTNMVQTPFTEKTKAYEMVDRKNRCKTKTTKNREKRERKVKNVIPVAYITSSHTDFTILSLCKVEAHILYSCYCLPSYPIRGTYAYTYSHP